MYFKLINLFFVCLLVFQSAFLKAQPVSQSLNSDRVNWTFYDAAKQKYFAANVPGTIHTDLLSNNLIPDPFFEANEKKVQWVDTLDWSYNCQFNVDANVFNQSHIELQLDGLDTYADVLVNNQLVVKSDNMFCEWKVDVKQYLKETGNRLQINFHSAVRRAKLNAAQYKKERGYDLPEGERVFIRKAQYHFGWDFAPRLVTCGIWKKVQLTAWSNFTVNAIQLQTESIKLTDGASKKKNYYINESGSITINSDKEMEIQWTLTNVKDPSTPIISNPILLKKGMNTIPFTFSTNSSDLWWSNGSGNANMQTFNFLFFNKKDKVIYAEKKVQTGYRTIELIQDKDSIGASFYFKINGKAIYCKGANFVPMDVFLPRVKTSDYRRLAQQVKDGGMNMLRIWGGGVYPDETFLNLCDSMGILIWQDFMFACAPTPPMFAEKHLNSGIQLPHVAEEVTQQINRIGRHPCLALWCGNNEVEEGWKNWGWQTAFHYTNKDSAVVWNDYQELFNDYLPSVLKSVNSNVAYVSSSPQIGWGHTESWKQGDSHYWGVWWGMEPYETYGKKVPRFASEFGMQSWPARSTLKTFLADSSFHLKAPGLLNHQKHPTGMENLNSYLKMYSLHYIDFDSYLTATQQLQADAMRYAVNAQFYSKKRCMGSLLWQLNDCWPGASWSMIDYCGKPKLVYWDLKSFYAHN